MNKIDPETERKLILSDVSEAIDALEAPPPPSPPRRQSPTDAAETLLVCMWPFRNDPEKWYEDAEPLMRRLTDVKVTEPPYWGEDDREFFAGLVADARAFLEHREMNNLPRLIRRPS